MLQGSQLVTD